MLFILAVETSEGIDMFVASFFLDDHAADDDDFEDGDGSKRQEQTNLFKKKHTLPCRWLHLLPIS